MIVAVSAVATRELPLHHRLNRERQPQRANLLRWRPNKAGPKMGQRKQESVVGPSFCRSKSGEKPAFELGRKPLAKYGSRSVSAHGNLLPVQQRQLEISNGRKGLVCVPYVEVSSAEQNGICSIGCHTLPTIAVMAAEIDN